MSAELRQFLKGRLPRLALASDSIAERQLPQGWPEPDPFADDAEFKEEEHPRDKSGEFTKGGGGHSRAKKGGEIAESNKAHYKGGQFLPSTEAPPGTYKFKGTNKIIGKGREMFEPGKWETAPTPLHRAIYPAISNYMQNAGAGREYLDVPYAKREEAKKRGAKFDWDKKKWYMEKEGNKDQFELKPGISVEGGPRGREPVTHETDMTLGVKGYLSTEKTKLGELIDRYNKGERWLEVKLPADVHVLMGKNSRDDRDAFKRGGQAKDMALDAALRRFVFSRLAVALDARDAKGGWASPVFDKGPFKPEEHPHAPAGAPEGTGGQFVAKGEGGGAAAELVEEPEAKEAPKAEPEKEAPSAAPRAAPKRAPRTEAYISPNIAEGLRLPQAIQGVQGVRQRALTRVSGQIDRALGLKTVSETDCIGAWADGAENTLMVVAESADPALERAAAAMKGHLAAQKAVLLFHPDEDGTEAMASFLIKGSLQEAHDKLLTEGLQFHTLEQVPDGSGVRVHIFVDSQDQIAALTATAKKLGGRPKVVPGKGEFIGTRLESGTDEEQRADARRVYAEAIEAAAGVPGLLGGRNVRDVWQDAHNHWSAALQRESADVGEQQAGVTPQPKADAKPPPGPKLTPLKGTSKNSHPATISSSLATGATADPTLYQRADIAAMKRSPKAPKAERSLYQNNVDLLRSGRDYPNLRPAEADKGDDELVTAFTDHVKDNLTFLYNAAPKEIRDHGPDWYEGAHGIAERQGARYNLPIQSVAGVYASQSPQKLWDMNVYLGDRILDIYHTQQDHKWDDEMEDTANVIWHKPDPARDADLQKEINAIRGKKLSECRTSKEKAQWIRTYDEAHSNMMFQAVASDGTRGAAWRWPPAPDQEEGDLGIATWQSTHAVEQAIKCIESGGDRTIISNAMGEQHKVRSFYNNILDPNSDNGDVTVDTHAVGAGLMRALGASAIPVMHSLHTTPSTAAKAREIGFVPAKGSQVSGIQGNYPFFADPYRAAAKDLKVKPRTVQSVVWEAKRLLFGLRPPKALVDEVEGAWRGYHDGKADLKKTQQAVIDAARKYNPQGGFFG